MRDDCAMTESIVAGHQTEAERDHITRCEACADAMIVDRFLDAALQAEPETPLHPAPVLWIQGQLERRRRLRAEIDERDAKVQQISWAALVAGWAVFLSLSWRPLLEWILSFDASSATGLVVSSMPPSVVIWTFGALFLITTTLATRGLVSEI